MNEEIKTNSTDGGREEDREIFGKVIDIVHEVTGIPKDKITLKSSLRENADNDTLNVDSLAMIEIIMDVEKQFDVSIPEEDYGTIETIESLVAYIKKNRQ